MRPQRVSGIVIPPSSLQKWPVGGYTIILSLRPETLDPVTDVELFTFRGEQGHGVTAQIVSSSLVFTVCSQGADNRINAEHPSTSSQRLNKNDGKQIIIDNIFGSSRQSENADTTANGFTTIYVSHVYRNNVAEQIDGCSRWCCCAIQASCLSAGSSNDTFDRRICRWARGQLGRVLMLSTALEKKDIDAMHTLFRNSNFDISAPATVDPIPAQRIGQALGSTAISDYGWVQTEPQDKPEEDIDEISSPSWTKCVALWRALYTSKVMFAYDARHFKILKRGGCIWQYHHGEVNQEHCTAAYCHGHWPR